jgi:hypothetical protein
MTDDAEWQIVFRGIRDEGCKKEFAKMWTERNTEVAPIPRGGPTNAAIAAIAAKVVDQHRGRKISCG